MGHNYEPASGKSEFQINKEFYTECRCSDCWFGDIPKNPQEWQTIKATRDMANKKRWAEYEAAQKNRVHEGPYGQQGPIGPSSQPLTKENKIKKLEIATGLSVEELREILDSEDD